MNLEKEILLSIDMDFDLVVPWYFIVKYAEEKNQPIAEETFKEHLKEKIDIHTEEIGHRYKPYLETDEYPPGIDSALQEVQRIYDI